jgi:RHS repeat-associated protein
VNANGTLAYLVDDGLGSVSESLSVTGSVQGAQLFAPYGSVRYSTGRFPGPQAFTGQRQNGSGPAYFNARYYDPAAGQFTSADTDRNSADAVHPTAESRLFHLAHDPPPEPVIGFWFLLQIHPRRSDCGDRRSIVQPGR